MASTVVQGYNGDLGADPLVGSRGRAPSQRVRGAKPPKAEALLFFGRLMEAANLPTFVQFGNAKKSDICVIFAKKIIDDHETGMGAGAIGPACALPFVAWASNRH